MPRRPSNSFRPGPAGWSATSRSRASRCPGHNTPPTGGGRAGAPPSGTLVKMRPEELQAGGVALLDGQMVVAAPRQRGSMAFMLAEPF